MRIPGSWLERHKGLDYGRSIGKRYENPRVMAGEALGLDDGWSIGKRYERPKVLVGET
jgi:hypothetical protein